MLKVLHSDQYICIHPQNVETVNKDRELSPTNDNSVIESNSPKQHQMSELLNLVKYHQSQSDANSTGHIFASATGDHANRLARLQAGGSIEEAMQGLLLRDETRAALRNLQNSPSTQTNGNEEEAEELVAADGRHPVALSALLVNFRSKNSFCARENSVGLK